VAQPQQLRALRRRCGLRGLLALRWRRKLKLLRALRKRRTHTVTHTVAAARRGGSCWGYGGEQVACGRALRFVSAGLVKLPLSCGSLIVLHRGQRTCIQSGLGLGMKVGLGLGLGIGGSVRCGG